MSLGSCHSYITRLCTAMWLCPGLSSCSRCCSADWKSGCTLSPGLSFAGSGDSLSRSLFPAGSNPYLVEKEAAGSWGPVVYLQIGATGTWLQWWFQTGSCGLSVVRMHLQVKLFKWGLWRVLVPLEQLLFVWKLPQMFLAQLHPWKSRITE